MCGATKKMAEYIGVGLELSSVSYKIYNVATADNNDVLTEIFKAKGLLCGSSTINYGILSALSAILNEFKGLKYIDKVGATYLNVCINYGKKFGMKIQKL